MTNPCRVSCKTGMSAQLAEVVVDEDEGRGLHQASVSAALPHFVVMEIVQNRDSPRVNLYALEPGGAPLRLLDSLGPGKVSIFSWTLPVDVSVEADKQSAFHTMLQLLYANCYHESWADTVVDHYGTKTVYQNPAHCMDCRLYLVYDPRSAPYMGMPVPSVAFQITQTFDEIKYEVSYVCKPGSLSPRSITIPDFSTRIRVYEVLRAVMRRLMEDKPHIQAFVLDAINKQAAESYKKAGFRVNEDFDERSEMPSMTADRGLVLPV